jgi:hypothetical protein
MKGSHTNDAVSKGIEDTSIEFGLENKCRFGGCVTDNGGNFVKFAKFFCGQKVRVRVRSSKNEVRCASACETIIKVRVCVRHTVKFLATQRLETSYIFLESLHMFPF